MDNELVKISQDVLTQALADAIAAADNNGVEISANALCGLAERAAEFYFSVHLQGGIE